jgi:hypothetical protein
MQNKPKKTKNELKTTFHTQVLELSEYLRSLNIDDSITTIYNNNVEFRLCLIKSKLDFLKTSISRSFVVYDIFFYLPCKNFLISITEDASENAETIDFISKSLEQAKGTENYENEIPDVQKRWNELFLTTKEVLSFLYQS